MGCINVRRILDADKQLNATELAQLISDQRVTQ